ncbi:MAG TPA: hypothetical protein VEI94_13520, partial [Candidatus Bathyarchaeia archaeon]|nr:hypothetical protein [Candidatus Bathyarchaeia archaeon]
GECSGSGLRVGPGVRSGLPEGRGVRSGRGVSAGLGVPSGFTLPRQSAKISCRLRKRNGNREPVQLTVTSSPVESSTE